MSLDYFRCLLDEMGTEQCGFFVWFAKQSCLQIKQGSYSWNPGFMDFADIVYFIFYGLYWCCLYRWYWYCILYILLFVLLLNALLSFMLSKFSLKKQVQHSLTFTHSPTHTHIRNNRGCLCYEVSTCSSSSYTQTNGKPPTQTKTEGRTARVWCLCSSLFQTWIKTIFIFLTF